MDSESWPAPPDNLDQFPEEYIAEDSGYCDKQYPELPAGKGAPNGDNDSSTTVNAALGSHSIPNYSDDPTQRTTQTLLRRPHQYENIEFIDDDEDEFKRNTWPLAVGSPHSQGQPSTGYENVDIIGRKQLSLIPEASLEDCGDITPTNSEEEFRFLGAKVERLSLPPPLVSRDTGDHVRPSTRSRKQQYENFVLPYEKAAVQTEQTTDGSGAGRPLDVLPHRNLPPASILRNQMMQKQRALSIDSAQSDLSAEDTCTDEGGREPVDVFEKDLEDLSDEDSWFSDSDFDSDEDEAHSVAYDQESMYSGDGSTCSDDGKVYINIYMCMYEYTYTHQICHYSLILNRLTVELYLFAI